MLYSAQYQKILEQSHATSPWGLASQFELPHVLKLVQQYQITYVLDYGAGRQFLAQELPKHFPEIQIHSYDPGIPSLSHPPHPAELVCCIDVLEHVEPDCVDSVLDNLGQLVQRLGFFTVATDPAKRILPDGRNAHLCIQPIDWWREKIQERFSIIEHKHKKFIVAPQ
jgi:hypothetical protein